MEEALDALRAWPVKSFRGTKMPTLVYSREQKRTAWAEASDRELLEGMQEGDELAFSTLIERKTQPLIQAAYRILGDYEEARDVVQVTFVRAWEKRDRFDQRWSPNTWIFRIATNLAIDQLRSRQTRERGQEPVRNHLRQVAAGGHSQQGEVSRLQQQEVLGIFQELAADLSERQRSVFVLREIEGMSSQEVAQVLDCKESTVRNHLFNARKVLRREVLQRYPEYARNVTRAEESA